MEALCITAKLAGPISLPNGALQLDALLMAAVAKRDNIPPAATADECVEIPIPVERSACGRFYLATGSYLAVEERELKHINKRFPIEQMQWMGDKRKGTINLSAGPTKHFRIPRELWHLERDQVRFWCVGDAGEIRKLLALITHLGNRRAVGLGRVLSWRVEPCEPWPGFPCMSADGEAMRNLPLDHPGLVGFDVGFERLEPPYWLHVGRAEIAVPARVS